MSERQSTQINKEGNESVAVAKALSLRIAPRKLRLAASLVRGMSAEDALRQLKFMPNKGAAMVAKAVQSAVANAHSNSSKSLKGNLYISQIYCDGGQVMKRTAPRARGSAFVVRRRMSNVTVHLSERVPAVNKKPAKLKAKS